MYKISKCIKTIDDFHIEEFEKLKVGVEIQDFTSPNLSQNEGIKVMDGYRKIFKSFSGIKAMHGPFLDLKPASPDPLIRQVSYKRYLDTLYIGNQLDMDYIIFHSQINPYINHPTLVDLNNKQMMAFWHGILKEVKHFKGKIVIENIFEEEPYMLKKQIEVIGMENIKINLDIGHAKLGKVSLETWIRELKEHIGYMHLHSNDGRYDLHRSLNGEEIKNLYEIMDKYSINVPLALEYKVENLQLELKRYRV